MKMKRMVSCILALLLVVSILPMTALAEEPNNNPADNTITETDKDIGTNNGKIENNNHTVENNVAVKRDLGENEENLSPYLPETGHIVNNNNVVKTNGTTNGGAESGTIEKNYGTVGEKGTDTSGNYGTIYNNQSGGKVLINQNTGVVDRNQKGGTIETNNGTVGSQGQFGDVHPNSGNYGTIETNSAGGKVLINQSTGTIETNYGLVGQKNGNYLVTDGDTGNFGTVTTNYGIITQNKNLVVTNEKIDGTPGYISVNDGTVKNNESRVWDNNGMVETNNGSVENNNKNGTMVTNNGFVTKNSGEVVTNNRIIETNNGIVETNNRYIGNNYGTVNTNNIDGTVHNSNTKTLDDVVGTNFGIVNNYDVDKKIYYGLSWGDSVDNLTSIENFVERGAERKLDEIANGIQRDGYKMTGYTAFERKGRADSQIASDRTTNYLMDAPVWLQIIWEKLGGKSESKATVPNVPTHVAAEDVKEGTLVRCGNMTFRVIEVGEDYILITTMSAQSKKDMENPMAYLAKYLTPEQLALLQGNSEQISEELAAKFFGGNTSHIVFKAAKNLFA